MRPETEHAILAKVDTYQSYRGSTQHAVFLDGLKEYPEGVEADPGHDE